MTEQPIDTAPVDLDLIEADLRDVESTLARLADGTYFPQPAASVPGTDAPASPADPEVDGSVAVDTSAAAGLDA